MIASVIASVIGSSSIQPSTLQPSTMAASTMPSSSTDSSSTGSSTTDSSTTDSSTTSHTPRPDGSLEDIRADIERVDQTIIRAIAERMELARAVGRVKALTGQPVTDPAREAAVVARAAALARDAGLPEDEIRALYWRLIAFSRRAQLDD